MLPGWGHLCRGGGWLQSSARGGLPQEVRTGTYAALQAMQRNLDIFSYC